jgi:hypothetical protein
MTDRGPVISPGNHDVQLTSQGNVTKEKNAFEFCRLPRRDAPLVATVAARKSARFYPKQTEKDARIHEGSGRQ